MEKVVKELQKLLAGTQIFLQNVRAYHWNIQGPSFFFLHKELGKLYDNLSDDADTIAERIRALRATPVFKYSEYLKTSEIKETNYTANSEIMLKEIISQLKLTHKQLYATQKAAVEAGDEGTNQLAGDMILKLEKTLWMYESNFQTTRMIDKLTKST